MKFSFLITFICLNSHLTVGQRGGNYEFEVYAQDPITGVLRPVATRPRTTTKRYANADFEVYEYDPQSGALKPVNTPNRATTGSYQNNPFLNPNNRPQNAITDRTTTTMSLSSSGCDNYWELKLNSNGYSGQLSIPSTNFQQAIIRIFLSVPTALPTVSK